MKQLILVLHLISGSILQVDNVTTVNKLWFDLNNNKSIFKGNSRLYTNGQYIYVNMNNIEYVEEKYVDVFDPAIQEVFGNDPVEFPAQFKDIQDERHEYVLEMEEI